MRATAFGARYAAAATAVTVLAVAVGMVLAGPAAHAGVIAGGGVALLLQVAVFWLLGLVLTPERRLLLIGLGMAARLLLLLVVALFVPRFGLPLGPTLLTLVSVFVLTTLLEPMLFQVETKSAS